MWDTRARSLSWEDPREEGKATYFRILALENPMDRGAWWATVHGVAKTWTRLSDQAQKEAKGTWTWGKKEEKE